MANSSQEYFVATKNPTLHFSSQLIDVKSQKIL